MTLSPEAVAASIVARYDFHQVVPTLAGLIGSRSVLAPRFFLKPRTIFCVVRYTVP